MYKTKGYGKFHLEFPLRGCMKNHIWVMLGALPHSGKPVVVVGVVHDSEENAQRIIKEKLKEHFKSDVAKVESEMFDLLSRKYKFTEAKLRAYFSKIGIPENEHREQLRSLFSSFPNHKPRWVQ